MAEHVTPGVHVEETGARVRPIEGVPTSTFGMAGLTRYGPTPYVVDSPRGDGTNPVAVPATPTLVTSFAEFQGAFGGLEEVGDTGLTDRVNYLAHAARAFFDNGGRRLYVARVFPHHDDSPALDRDFAALPVGDPPVGTFRARWPGAAGNEFGVSIRFQRGGNVLVPAPGGSILDGVEPGCTVEIFTRPDTIPGDDVPPVAANVRIVAQAADGSLGLRAEDGRVIRVTDGSGVAHLRVTVAVRWGERLDAYPDLELDPTHPRGLANVLRAEDPADPHSLVWFDSGATAAMTSDPAALVDALRGLREERLLAGAGEGDPLTARHLAGRASERDERRAATGLAALAEVDEIAILAAPDAVRLGELEQLTAARALIAHCEAPGAYRIGLVDPPKHGSLEQVRRFRAAFDSSYAALYYPWLEIADPTLRPDGARATLQLPPSGFVAGIYARRDLAAGVHTAPADEAISGITGLRESITAHQQSVLNPEGVNTVRVVNGENRVWGARTMSSDAEWIYVNIRRQFLYLEHSIARSTQWAVFEPNAEPLWASVRESIEAFLLTQWHAGAFAGARPEQAFFVRCDLTTMTQNDLDNGRLICLVGVAPLRPAEFVILRIGQWTADAQRD